MSLRRPILLSMLLLLPLAPAGAEEGISWHGWSDNLFREAQRVDRPVLLYLEAPWCLECRAFEDGVLSDPQVEDAIRGYFLAIRVDRDLRPDIYARYQRGPVPSLAFLTPRGNSIYFKDGDDLIRAGGSGFTAQTLRSYLGVVAKYHAANSGKLDEFLEGRLRAAREARNRESRPLSEAMIEVGINSVLRAEDPIHGGLQGIPRIPSRLPVAAALLAYDVTGDTDYQRFARAALDVMASAPVRDPLSGAFHAAALSPDWSAPVDGWLLGIQADMLAAYLDGYRVLREERYREVAQELVDLLLERFFVPDPGAFRSAIYPSSRRPTEGWSWADLGRVLKKGERSVAAMRWDLPAEPDLPPRHPGEGETVKAIASALGMSEARVEARLASARRKLVAARAEEPGWSGEDWFLAAENARAAAGLLQASALTGRTDARDAALAALSYIGFTLVGDELAFRGVGGSPIRVIPVRPLVDQLELVHAWFVAYQLTGDREHLESAEGLLDLVVQGYADEVGGGFFDRRPAFGDVGDLRLPDRRLTENSTAAMLLVDWSHLGTTSRGRLDARKVLESFADEFTGYGPDAAAFGMAVYHLLRTPLQVIVIDDGASAEGDALRAAALAAPPLRKLVRPATEARDAALLRGVGIPPQEAPAAWVVEDGVVRGPFRDPDELREALGKGRS